MIDGDVSEDLPATVTRLEPPRLLEYTWGADLLLWELEPVDRGRDARRHGWDGLHAAHEGRLGIAGGGPPDDPERSG
jgi:uncharacterized protein YndB with AHSA1/START domain